MGAGARREVLKGVYKEIIFVMMDYNLNTIRAIVFDVDGVLSAETVSMDAHGDPLRTVNIKDGYAIQLAVKQGMRIAIMTGGNTPAIAERYRKLGVDDVFIGCRVKIQAYEQFLVKYGLKDEEVLYVGDDIPDYEIMTRVGCPCCPKDACPEIKSVSRYVSDRCGGYGVGRDVIEQVLRAQGLWMADSKAFGW